jgi:hypothetical protein
MVAHDELDVVGAEVDLKVDPDINPWVDRRPDGADLH